MKKLVSLLSAVAMLAMLAVPASAALSYEADGDGWYVISELPSDAEVAAYAPTLKATTTKLETEDDLKAVSTTVNKKFKSKLATHDIYKITYDMTDIGTFVNAYDGDYNNSFFGLYDITIGFDSAALPAGFETYALNYTLPDGSSAAAGVGVDTVTGILNVAYTAPGVSYDKIFPARTNDEGIVVDAGTYKAEYILAYPTTTEAVTLPFSQAKITYQKNVTNAATTNITCDDIVLGTVVEPEPPVVEPETTIEIVGEKMDLATETAIGAAWDIKITNFDSAKAYQVKFTDAETGENRRDEGFKTLDVSAVAETEGDIAFAIIMNLTAARNVNLDVQVQ